MIDWTNVTGTYLTFKKSNPQVLPPAGRNFYDSTDELMFENAQKLGALPIDSPVEYTRSLRNLKYTIGDNNKRSGKKLFISNLVNAHPAYTPLINKSITKISLKPPRNPTGNIANTREGVKQSTRQDIQNNIVERFQTAHRQSSSLSRLGNQNYNNMINENKEHIADQKYDQYQQNYHTAQNDQHEESDDFEQTYVNPNHSNHLDTIIS
jgi:hypothetical protein